MKDVFARDENGELLRKKPCQTPGCHWPNWHVCLVGKRDTTNEVLAAQDQRKKTISKTKVQQLADGRAARWEQYREENRGRDEKVIARYKEGGVGIGKIANEVGLSYQTVRTIITKAAARGEVTMRKQGLTVQRGAS